MAPLLNIQRELRRRLSGKEVSLYSRQQFPRVVKDILQSWVTILAAFFLAAYFATVPAYFVAFAAIGLNQYRLFILGHDGIHGNLHSTARINDWLCRWVLFGPMGMSLQGARRNHLRHHRLVGEAGDPDRYLHSLENKKGSLGIVLHCLGIATFVSTVKKVALPAEGHNPQRLKDWVAIAVTQGVVLSLLVLSSVPWWGYLVLWICPIYGFVFVPNETRAFCEHAVARLPDSAADLDRLVTHLPSWWEARFFSPLAMNYHAEHHLWPQVPYYALASLHRRLGHLEHVHYRTSYFGTVFDCYGYFRERELQGGERVHAG